MTEPLSLNKCRVWVAGHRGMVGSALVRALSNEGASILTVPHEELDLRRQTDTEAWVNSHRPDAVFLAAARVGGIWANDHFPAQFLYDNLMIQTNVLEAARLAGVGKIMLLGSSCIYPREAPQPITEDSLLTGPLEPTNQWYAIAKIAGVKMAQAYRRQYGMDIISVMPTNLYGPNDDYHPQNSHVVAALIRRIDTAYRDGVKQVTIWGSGSPRRELLHVDDLAQACLFLMKGWSGDDPINIGSGEEVSILELAEHIADVVGWDGAFLFDRTKPDGTPRKLLDTRRLTGLGWRAGIPLKVGLRDAYRDFSARRDAGELDPKAAA